MMNDTALPMPLVPAEVDLTDFAFMPLDVVRLRDSDLTAEETPEACWAALLLWAASWHQIPAGSMPDSEQWQAKHAGYVARGKIDKAWAEVRGGALRNWVRCADGRLYHPVVAEKALIAWKEKLARRARTEAATREREARRRAQQTERDETRNVQRDDERDVQNGERNVERDVHQGREKGEGEGQGQGDLALSGAAKPRPVRKCPSGFLVGRELQLWAREKVPGLDIRAETEKFRDHTFRTALSDWDGAWRNWMRRAHQDAEKRPGAAAPTFAGVL